MTLLGTIWRAIWPASEHEMLAQKVWNARAAEQSASLRADLSRTTDLIYMRTVLLCEGRTHPLEILPSDLSRFKIEPWNGAYFGMRCVESPIVMAKR